jgi:hypothetical protein
VCAVDNRQDPKLARASTHVLHREDLRRRRRDVADRDHPRPLADRVPELRRRADDQPRPGLLAHEPPDDVDGAVLAVGRQHLVARPERQRARDDVEARGRVRDEDQPLGVGADVRGQAQPRGVDQLREAAAEELVGIPLELPLVALVRLEHRARDRAVGAVVEKHDVEVEQEALSHPVDSTALRKINAPRVPSGFRPARSNCRHGDH